MRLEIDQNKGTDFWGQCALAKGDVDLYQIKKAVAQGLLDLHTQTGVAVDTFPVLDAYDPAIVRKAILDNSYGEAGLNKDLHAAHDQLIAEIRKARGIEADEQGNLIQKAVNTSNNAMIHTIADPDVTILFRRVYPLQALIGVEPNIGKVANWDAIPPNGAGSAYCGSEDPVLTESDIVPKNRSADIKLLYAVGRVTKLSQMAGLAQVPSRDFMSLDILAKMEQIKQLRERLMLGVTRDTTVADTVFTPAGEYEYKGLYELITANTAAPNYVTAGSGVDTWDEIQPLLNESARRMYADGLNPDVCVSDYKTFNRIREGMNEMFRSENMESTKWGIRKIVLAMPNGDVPMIPEYFLPATAGTNGSMFLLDTLYLKRRVLYPEMYMELAQVNTSKKYVVDAAEVLIDKSDVDGTSSLQGGVFGITLN
jgi:hypothetical protein